MGKGGSSTSVEIPDYIENAARNNLQRADFVSKLGYVPQSYTLQLRLLRQCSKARLEIRRRRQALLVWVRQLAQIFTVEWVSRPHTQMAFGATLHNHYFKA